MELYINWIAAAGKTHDVFYVDRRIISSYREYTIGQVSSPRVTGIWRLERYVKTIVSRYKHSPNIFAWELMNEARCLGDLPGGPDCVPGSNTLHTWYEEQANFIRRLYVILLDI